MTEDGIAAIKARHLRDDWWRNSPSMLSPQMHDDRGALLAEVERLRAELYEERLTVATVVSLKAMEKRLEEENDMLRRQARKASRSRDAVVRMRERLLAEVERLRADAAALREALKQAASDLDAAAEDAGRSYYADRAQAAREALEGGR